MTDPSENPVPRKPFQYSLRSLFVITVLLALWLGLWKTSPLLGVAFIAVPFLSLPAIPFYFRGRSLIRNGWHRAGIVCLANGLLVALIPIALSGLIQVPGLEKITGKPKWLVFAYLFLPLLMYIMWWIRPLPDPDADEERKRTEAARKASERTNESSPNQR